MTLGIEPERRTRTIEIAIRFRYPEADGLPAYSDSLFLGVEDYNALDAEQVAALEDERYQAWAEQIRNPPAPPEPEPVTPEAALSQAQEALQAVDVAREALSVALDAVNAQAQPDATEG